MKKSTLIACFTFQLYVVARKHSCSSMDSCFCQSYRISGERFFCFVFIFGFLIYKLIYCNVLCLFVLKTAEIIQTSIESSHSIDWSFCNWQRIKQNCNSVEFHLSFIAFILYLSQTEIIHSQQKKCIFFFNFKYSYKIWCRL